MMGAVVVVPALRLGVCKEFRLGQWTDLPVALEPDGCREAEEAAGQT